MKITIKQAIESREYFKNKIQQRKERIKRMEEQHAPKIVLENEEWILKEIKKEYIAWELALDFYRKGYLDAQNENSDNFRLLNQELKPEERLLNAIFNETRYVREENEQQD